MRINLSTFKQGTMRKLLIKCIAIYDIPSHCGYHAAAITWVICDHIWSIYDHTGQCTLWLLT